MAELVLFDNGNHKNVLLEDLDSGLAVQANQHVIIHDGAGMVLDPGGHKVYNRVLSATLSKLRHAKLRYLFLSHQDPDIVAAVNGWLMTTDAEAYISSLWVRFVPHFGLDRLVENRLKPIGDEGMTLDLSGCPLSIIPAHFLHSPGNHQVYDPISRILYSGDLGASLGAPSREVTDFDEHVQYMEGFHKRYMAANRAMRAWAAMARTLDIEIIAPQHGALFRGKEQVGRFIDWCDQLQCGVDLMPDAYRVPGR
jgi:flavorubredoxin